MKLEAVEDIMNRIDFVIQRTGLACQNLCRAMNVSHRTYKRWKRRKQCGQPLVRVPGPVKTGVFDPAVLTGEIAALHHSTHRTMGIGRLYGKYSECLSRRELDSMVAEVRDELNDIRRQNLRHVEWLVPGVVWAIDGTQYRDESGKREMLTVRDLCSKYLFCPMATEWTPCSEEVGGHMARLLIENDAPLFTKMDNGSNLVGQGTMNVLANTRIIPFISPPYYPRYNGSLEHAQGEIKEAIKKSLPLGQNVSLREFGLHAALAAHHLNHRPKDILKGKTPCQVFYDETRRMRFTQPERNAIYDWINLTQESILKNVQSTKKNVLAKVRRKAIEAWLIKNNIIKVSLNELNVTRFSD
jgi:hypothetical protein